MSNQPPELAAAAKRIAALEADVANLRRGMVQQLTATGRLVQQALALDDKQFGGRFLAGRQPNPQEELGIAAEILAAAAGELEKRGAGAGATTVAGTPMTEVLRSELVAREGELAELRRQARELQEEHAATVAGLTARIEQAEERAPGASSDSAAVLRADRAEALGLCSELLRVIQAAPAGGDDVQITCGVLQDALKEEGGLGMVCQAAESALVSWAEALVEALGQAKAATAGLDGLRATAGEWQKQSAQLKAELDKARAEAAKAVADARSTAERSGIIEREITKLQSERETLVRDVERLQVELGEQRRAAHEANMARSRDRQETESFRAKAKDEADQTVVQAVAEVAAANQRAEQALAERDQLQGRISLAQERIDRSEAERERAAAELAALRRELDAARAEADVAVARDRSGAERTATLQTERDQLVAERERALAEVGTLRRDLDLARTEREALQAKTAAQLKQAEATALDRDRLQGERDQARSQVANAAAERDRFRAALEAAQEERSALARAKDEQASQLTLRLTEKSRELGEMKQVQARLAGENDRLTAENELLNKAAERGKTDVAEMKRRAEAAAQDRRRLEDAETRAVAAENRIAEVERRGRAALAERDTQLAQSAMEIKRLGDEVESLKKRFKQAADLLVVARAAVEKASTDLKAREK